MPPVIIRYQLDPTGVNPNNLVQGEEHAMVRRKVRAIAPTYGAFFSQSMKVIDKGTGVELIKGVQYHAVEMYEMPTAKYGKEVCAIILITDENVGDTVRLQYQAVGGDFSTSAAAVAQMMENLQLDSRPVSWPSVIDKPSEYPPSHHLHDAGDVYGFEYLVHSLERIRSAIVMGDAGSHDKIYAYLDNAIQNLQQLIANSAAGLATHLQATDPHPQYLSESEGNLAYVKRGAGVGQLGNDVKIGWSGSALKATIDTATDLGNFAFQAWVTTQITNLINGAPASLNTLAELATAINNDPAFSTTMTTALGLKAPLASPALTGIPTAPTAAPGVSTTQLATTAFVTAADNAAMAAHVAMGDPHPQYQTAAEGAAAYVKQGGGTGQLTNTLYMGWSAASKLKLQVDASDQGNVAMESWVNSQINTLIGAAPGTLDTLNEIATALGNDPNFASTITTQLASKAPLASPTFSGTVSAPSYSGAGTGLTGTAAGLSIGGNAATSTTAVNATNALYHTVQDGGRNAYNIAPSVSPYKVRFDFTTSASAGTGGNYAGVMTFSPYTGSAVGGGDGSYQLAFGATGANATGLPQLNLRMGLESVWGGWYSLWHSGNLNPSVVAAANSVVQRDGSGYLQGSYVHMVDDGIVGTSGTVSGIICKRGDNYYRSTSAASVKAFLGFTAADVTGVVQKSGDTMTGPLTMAVTSGVIAQATGDTGRLKVHSGGGDAAFIQFLRSGVFGAYFGLDTDNQWKVGGWSMGGVSYTLLHAGNFNAYAPGLGGAGASGTWGINITGNAATVTSLNSGQVTSALGYTPLNPGAAANTLSGRLLFPDGSAGAPSIAFGVDGGVDTGFYHPADGYIGVASNSQQLAMFSPGAMSLTGTFTATGNVISQSDIRTKTDIRKIENALDKVHQLNGVTYQPKELAPDGTAQARRTGLIAQDVEKVLPEATESREGILNLAYGNLAGLLAEAIKELSDKHDAAIKELKDENAAIRKELAAFKSGE